MSGDEFKTAVEKFKDRTWRLNNLYWIEDEKGRKVKFKLNLVQRLLLANFWFLNLVLKSRQHGVTTFICILYLDICLFNSNIHAGIIAHTKDDVESIFENKVKFAFDNLPENLRKGAEEFLDTEKDTGKMLKFANGSSIRVGISLRSGTFQYLHISEFGKVCAKYPEKAREIVTGALNTVHVGQYITIESTAEGRSGYFYDFCQAAQKRQAEGRKPSKMEYRLHFFGWHQDPRNRLEFTGPLVMPESMRLYFEQLQLKHGIGLDDQQKAWYMAKSINQGEDMLREYPSTPEEAFQASIQGAYYTQQMTHLRSASPCRLTLVPHEQKIAVDTAWDLGMDDTTCIVFRQRVGIENRIIDYYEMNGEALPHYAKVLRDKPYVYGTHYLPHDSQVRSLNDGETREQKLKKLGFQNVITVSRTANIEDGIEETRAFLRSCWIDKQKCDRLIAALDEYRKAWNEKMGVYASHPLHNWASNPADAFRTLACGIASHERSRQMLSRPSSNQSMQAYV